MADAYIKPILDAVVTILTANFNTQIAAIDSNAPTWNTAHISKYLIEQITDLPWVSVFPLGDAVHDSTEISDGFDANWQIATVIDTNGKDQAELTEYLDLYLTALIRALTRGSSGSKWTFNQTAEVSLTRSGLEPLDEEPGTIISACYAIWECSQCYDPVNE